MGNQGHHPWRELRTAEQIEVHFIDLPAGMWGAVNGNTMWIDRGLSQVERRCTIAHELEHHRRGDTGCQPEKIEAQVRAAAARRLLPDPHLLADALVWARDLAEAADTLWVDQPTLHARLDPRHLHPAERAIILRRIDPGTADTTVSSTPDRISS